MICQLFKQLALFTFFAAAFLSCKNNKKAEEQSLTPIQKDSGTVEEKKNYMPIKILLQGEIKWVENFAGAVLLKTKTDTKKDSVYISYNQFKSLASEIISSEMDSVYFTEHFKEESIADGGGGSEGLTFIYTSDGSTQLKKVIVYITRTETTDKVSRVYFERDMNRGDSSITQRCTWKLQHYLLITESSVTKDGVASTSIRKAIYDPADNASD